MERVTDTITGAAGIGIIEGVAHIETITQGGTLLVQIIIGIVTLIKMFAKRKKTIENGN